MSNFTLSILELDGNQNEDKIIWNWDCKNKFTDLQIVNHRLFNVLRKVGYKAAMSVAIALTELIQQRSKKFFPNIDTTKEFAKKIEALWAGAIDPLYLKTSDYEWKSYDDNGDSTPYISNWFVLRQMSRKYIKNSFYVHPYLINLSMLARHLASNKKIFDDWFVETLRKTALIFPYASSYAHLEFDGTEARYDYSIDAPVPREFFFDQQFVYSEEAAKSVLNVFLQSLDYDNNPWLCAPEEMLAKGFKDTPYEI